MSEMPPWVAASVMKPVTITEIDDGHWVIAGGHLNPEQGWIARTRTIAGRAFMTVGARDLMFTKFCKCSGTCEAILQVLKAERNKGCEGIINAALRELQAEQHGATDVYNRVRGANARSSLTSRPTSPSVHS